MTKQQLLLHFPELRQIPNEKLQQVCAHFQNAPDWLLDHFIVKTLPANTVFIREGQSAHHVFFIANGYVKAIDYRILGVEYDFIHFNDVYAMGAMEILMDLTKYRTTLKTINRCTVIQIPREHYEQWLMSDVDALRNESRLMGKYLLEQGRLAREYLFLPGPERLAELWVQKYQKYATNGILYINESRQQLANETGFGIKTVNRAVKSLTEAGLITRQERGITVNHEQYQSLKKLIHTIVAPESE